MGHKHTSALAMVFSMLAVAQLVMVVGVQRELNDFAASAELSASVIPVRPVARLKRAAPAATERAERRNHLNSTVDGVNVIRGKAVRTQK